MTILFRRTFTRPSSAIPFFEDTEAFTQHITDTYVTTGKCVTWRQVTIDNNVMITESVWASLADMSAALSDSLLINNASATHQYCDDNLIMVATEVIS